MHSYRTHSGDQSHLFNSMRSYLCNQNRVQPIIGLGSVIELCTDAEPPVYLCEVCVLRINKTDIKTHIIGSLHRCNYIRSHHVSGLRADTDLTSVAWRLMELAKFIEKHEGTGYVQVLHVEEVIYKEMMSQPVANVLAQVKEMKKQTKITMLRTNICSELTESYYTRASPPVESHTSAFTPIRVSSNCASSIIPPDYKQPQSIDGNSRQVPSYIKAKSPTRTLPGTQDPSEIPSQPVQILHNHRNITIQSPVRSIIQTRTSSPPVNQIKSKFKSPTRYKRPSRTLSSVTALRYCKGWSPVRAPGQNNTKDESRDINTARCTAAKSHRFKTSQTMKLPGKHVAHCQNSSLTVTIMQKPNQENIRCQKNTQDMPTTLKLIRTLGPTEPEEQDQCLAIQEEQQTLQPFKPDDHSLEVESTLTSYLIASDDGQQLHDGSLFNVQSPKLSDETLESYGGTLPLIGLQTVIKCQSVDGDPPPCCYLCQPCSLKVLKSDIIHHLISPQHQLSYINFQHPNLSVGIDPGCYGNDPALQTTVRQLEQKEGRGQVEVMRLSACLYSEVLERDYHWCMKMLNCGFTKEVKPKQGHVMEKHSRTSGCSITEKQSTRNSLNHRFYESIQKPKGKLPLSCLWSQRAGSRLKETGHVEPLFKVSLSLKQGSVVVDRQSLVSTTVAPEIECQSPEAIVACQGQNTMYTENDTISKRHTLVDYSLISEHAQLELNPETLQNIEQHSNQHPDENIHSLGYTAVQTGTNTCEYMYDGHSPDTVTYTAFPTSCLNSRQQPEASLEHMDCNSFLKDVFVPTPADGCPGEELSSAKNDHDWIMKGQPDRDDTCHWLLEGNPVTQSTSHWHKDHLVFVAGDETQVMSAEQVFHQETFGERNYETVNVPVHMYPEATGAVVPMVKMYPSQYVSQNCTWSSSQLTVFQNQYSLNPY